MIILPPAVPIGAAGEKNCVFASNSLFSRPFFDVSAQNFCVIHGNLAAYCVIPPPPQLGGGVWDPSPRYDYDSESDVLSRKLPTWHFLMSSIRKSMSKA